MAGPKVSFIRRFQSLRLIYVHVCLFTIALCPDPTAPANGAVTFTGNTITDLNMATYSCNSGFELIGNTSATCIGVSLNASIFSPDAPTCQGNHKRLGYSDSAQILKLCS